MQPEALLNLAGFSQQTHPKMYEAIKAAPNTAQVEYLIEGFKLLIKSKLTGKNHEKLYMHLLKNKRFSLNLAKGFTTIKLENLSYLSHQALYECIANNFRKTDDLPSNLVLLNARGFSEHTYPSSYRYLMTMTHGSGASFAQGLNLLIEKEFTENEYPQLYEIIIKNPNHAKNLANALITLMQAGLSQESHPKHYECVVENPNCAGDLAENLVLLKSKNFNEKTYPTAYHSLIQIKNNFALSLARGFNTLIDADFTPQDHEEIYSLLIKNSKYSEKLSKNLVSLYHKNFNIKTHPDTYQRLMQASGQQALSLTEGILLLIKEKVTDKKHSYLYKALMENSTYAENLATGFISLIKEHLDHSSHKNMYLCLINNAIFANDLGTELALLNQKGFSEKTHPKSYKTLIQMRNGYALSFAEGLNILIDAQISEIECPELFLSLTYTNHPKLLAENIAALFQANLSVNTHSEIYELFFDDPTIQIKEILTLLKDLGITYSENNNNDKENVNQFFSKNLLIKHIELSTFILESLKNSGYTLEYHKTIIIKILSGLIDDFPNRAEITKLLSVLVNYANSNKLLTSDEKGYTSQIKEIEKLLKQQKLSLTAGPLVKSTATLEIERILNLISTLDTSQIHIRFDDFLEHYILNIPNESEINLSILLKNANLTQLILDSSIPDQTATTGADDSILRLLENMLEIFIENLDTDSSKNPILELLPPLQQKAIKLYTGKFYLNINKLFRSEALDDNPNNLIVSNSIEINHLIFFLLGCLATDALNKLPVLISQDIECFTKQFKEEFDKRYNKRNPQEYHSEFKKQLKTKLNIKYGEFLVPKDALLDRGERLEPETIRRRLANSWSFPALTSFSALANGLPDFYSSGEIRTKLENLPSISAIIYKDEEEMVLAPGTQVMTTQWSKGLISRIVNSPSLVQPNACWSDTAIAYAFKHYLSQEYKDEKSEIILNGKHLKRPNHNVTHVIRVMKIINLVLDYFAKHAKDPEFKEFCKALTEKDIEWLKTAAAFSITGRESEIGASEYPELYAQYRENSANHFMHFINETKSLGMSKDIKMKERMYDIIKYMGNPYYEQGTHEQNTINYISDETERKIRAFYLRLLSIAHNLDLARCKNAKDYIHSLNICLDLSKQSPLQQEDFSEMIRYNIELIKAHGSCLTCDIKPNGKIIDVCQDYENIYLESSTSLKKLRERTESIPLPKFSRNISSGYKKSN